MVDVEAIDEHILYSYVSFGSISTLCLIFFLVSLFIPNRRIIRCCNCFIWIQHITVNILLKILKL